MSKLEIIRNRLARWLSIAAIALLGYCGVVLVVAWVLASRDGEIPSQWWEFEGSHGPWRHYYPGRSLIEQAIATPLWAFCAGAAAFVARPGARAAVLAGICLVLLFLVTGTHFWLID